MISCAICPMRSSARPNPERLIKCASLGPMTWVRVPRAISRALAAICCPLTPPSWRHESRFACAIPAQNRAGPFLTVCPSTDCQANSAQRRSTGPMARAAALHRSWSYRMATLRLSVTQRVSTLRPRSAPGRWPSLSLRRWSVGQCKPMT